MFQQPTVFIIVPLDTKNSSDARRAFQRTLRLKFCRSEIVTTTRMGKGCRAIISPGRKQQSSSNLFCPVATLIQARPVCVRCLCIIHEIQKTLAMGRTAPRLTRFLFCREEKNANKKHPKHGDFVNFSDLKTLICNQREEGREGRKCW